MVKRYALLMIVIAIFLLIVGCNDTKYWCDYCHAWYYDDLAHYVTENTVDFILCDECYKRFIAGDLHYEDSPPVAPVT